jgi:hypothetical protein
MIELFKVVAIPERKNIYWIDYECRKLATLRVSIKYGDKIRINECHELTALRMSIKYDKIAQK